MDFAFGPMEPEHAREIAAWRYDLPYDFYDMAADEEGIDEHLDPERLKDYYAAFSGNSELAGFLSFGEEARVAGGDYSGDALDIGLGLRPDLTGKGLGLGFVKAGLEFANEQFSPEGFRLSVATFNERAIRVYERAGFRRGEVFVRGGGDHEFLMMRRES